MLNKKACNVQLKKSIAGIQNETVVKGNRYLAISQMLTKFLKALMPDAESIDLRFFTPDRDQKKARKSGGSISQLISPKMIDVLNDVNKTHGVYFVVNSGGQEDNDITQLNACFVESDTKSIEDQNSDLDDAPIETSARIETKKSVHAYFLLTDQYRKDSLSEEEWREVVSKWREVQTRLIAYFAGDEKLKNPSRVMRLPGFDHLSKDGSRKGIKLTHLDPERRYTLDELLEAFPPVKQCLKEQAAHTTKSESQSKRFETSDLEEAKRKAGQIIMARSRQNPSGSFPFKCPLHNGNGNTSAYYYPDSNSMGCGKCEGEFNIKAALERFGIYLIPEKKSIDIQMETEEEEEKPKPKLLPLSQDQIVKYDYLVENLIPNVGITIVAGQGGAGKSYMLLSIAGSLIKGEGFPVRMGSQSGSVLWYTQDEPKADIDERARKLQIDRSQLYVINEPLSFAEKDGWKTLREHIGESDAKLVMIDTLFHYCGHLKLRDRDEVAKFYAPFHRLSEKLRIPFIFTNHFNKSIGNASVKDLVSGSAAVVQLSSSTLVVQRYPDEHSETRKVEQIKYNYTRKGETLKFRIEEETGILTWEGVLEHSESESLNIHQKRGRLILEILSDCDEIVSTELRDRVMDGLSLSRDMYANACEAVGISFEAHTLYKKKGTNTVFACHPDKVNSKLKKVLEFKNIA